MELHSLTIHELLDKIQRKEIATDDIFASLDKRIKKVEDKVKAFVRVDKGASSFSTEKGQVEGKLRGIPIAIKDNICVKDSLTECCSRILEGFRPPYDATVISRLRNAGASIYHLRTNMDEFAFGSSTENSCYGPSYNPYDLDRVTGGSSGGSAACVAGDEAIAVLGSDTGGSIRQPASFCGVVGLKPSYGRVSRYGLIAFASSLDQIGPITKDVRDAAILLNIIAGYDEMDSTSQKIPVPDYTKSLVNDVGGLRIGVPKEYFVEGLEKEVRDAVMEAIEVFKNKGAVVKEISLKHTEYAVAVYYIIATAEASSNLARFDGVQYGYRRQNRDISLIEMYKQTRGEGFGEEAKRRIILGTYVLSHGYYEAYYVRAQKVRTLIKKDFDEAFKEIDCIITPTTPSCAFRIGEKLQDPLSMYLSDIYTISANLAGIPAISIPAGFSNGLPIGIQILGRAFDEETILRAAYSFECSTDWHKMKPRL